MKAGDPIEIKECTCNRMSGGVAAGTYKLCNDYDPDVPNVSLIEVTKDGAPNYEIVCRCQCTGFVQFKDLPPLSVGDRVTVRWIPYGRSGNEKIVEEVEIAGVFPVTGGHIGEGVWTYELKGYSDVRFTPALLEICRVRG